MSRWNRKFSRFRISCCDALISVKAHYSICTIVRVMRATEYQLTETKWHSTLGLSPVLHCLTTWRKLCEQIDIIADLNLIV